MPIRCDAFGNNVAFACPLCGHPILAIARTSWRGSSADKAVHCPNAGCEFRGWVELMESSKKLKVRTLMPIRGVGSTKPTE